MGKEDKELELYDEKSSSTVYDDVIRTECERHSEFLIPLVNHVFHTNYTRNAKVELLSDMHHDAISSKMDLKVTDAYFRITENGSTKVYHLECQSKGDASMIVRIMEYDFMIAIDQMANKMEAGCFESDITLPQTTVLYLRHAKDMPDEFKVHIHYKDQVLDYQAPIVKAQLFTLRDIMEKELYILLPFYLMRYEKQMKQEYKTKEAAEENFRIIEEAIRKIKEELLLSLQQGKINVYQEKELLKFSQRILMKLSEKSQLQEGLVECMSGQIIETEAHDIYVKGMERGKEQGIEEGIERGIEQGIEHMLPLMVELSIKRTGDEEQSMLEVAEVTNENLDQVRAIWYAYKKQR